MPKRAYGRARYRQMEIGLNASKTGFSEGLRSGGRFREAEKRRSLTLAGWCCYLIGRSICIQKKSAPSHKRAPQQHLPKNLLSLLFRQRPDDGQHHAFPVIGFVHQHQP